MDLHILIVIACVFLASFGSLLFINKFLRRKTFEEIIAEKKALTDKIYGKERATLKKPKKQSLKKELKREKKQRIREQINTEQEDSDANSEQASVDDEPQGLSKTHVEFEPDAEVVNYNSQTTYRRSSNAEKENLTKQFKGKKDKKSCGKSSGILIHKNDQNNVKENVTADVPTNHFDIKTPKDAVELKRIEKKEEKTQLQQNKKEKNVKKFDNRQLVEKAPSNDNVQTVIDVAAPVVIKEVKQLEEKVRQSSPKTIQQKNKQQNKKQKDLKDAVIGLEKLSESDTVGVSLLMNLFRRAELNRSEIQILIDYLLNRQQDMPSSHSEWSDDICQKLKRQLEEKEKALAEEQEASIGIQAKLRELRTEINTERASMSSTIKSYVEKIQVKDQDIALLEQKIKTHNDNLSLERQQFQAKLIHEKQSGSQELIAKLQMMQNELAHKDKCIAELTCIVNASRQAVEESQQKNEIIQTKVRTLEQQCDELEQVSNNRIFELEKAKQLECGLNDAKIEMRNLQNALESARSDAGQSSMELEGLKTELSLVRNKGLVEKQQEIQALQAKNSELTQQIMDVANKTKEQSKEQTGLQANFETLKQQLAEKEQKLAATEATKSQIEQKLSTIETASKQQAAEQIELQKLVESLKKDMTSKNQQLQISEQQTQNQQEIQKMIESLKIELKTKEEQLQENEKQTKQQDLQKLVDALQIDVAKKNQQLKEVEKETEKFNGKEKELLQQLQEQKEKNNELRIKNWKLVEALQSAEAKVVTNQSPNAILVQQEKLLGARSKAGVGGSFSDKEKDQKDLRDVLQRLCPEAVKACAGTALSVSLNQWVEQVLTAHIKHQQQISSSHKSTQSNSSHSPSESQHTHSNLNNANGTRSSSSSSSIGLGADSSALNIGDKTELLKENSILRIRIDELTKLAKKTENTLSDLMQKAEEQDEHWRNIMHSKDEKIRVLQHSNGQEEI